MAWKVKKVKTEAACITPPTPTATDESKNLHISDSIVAFTESLLEEPKTNEAWVSSNN
jgi:hypothetical protein